ncbi:hypothetical protein MASR1M60_14900 [Rhodocyclaceae bacterium]
MARRIFLIICLTLLPSLLTLVRAELVVIVHPDSGIKEMTRDELINIYLGRFRRLSSGQVAEPIDAPNDSSLRTLFYQQLVGKSLSEINAYWARLVFSGKTRPPQSSPSIDEAIRHVSQKPAALTYIPREQVDGRVRVVFSFPP